MKDSKDYRGFMDTMKSMTWKQRFEHIWSYYKFRICLILFLCVIGVGIISVIHNMNMEVLISGLSSNVEISQEGKDYLTEGYMAHLNGDENSQRCDLALTDFDDPANYLSSGLFTGNTYDPTMTAITLSGASALDYMIMDEEALKQYMSQEIMMDLTEFFTEEELEKFGNQLVKLELVDEETEETVSVTPVAIVINDLPFTKDCLSGAKNYFFAIGSTTPSVERCRDFWEYLLAWESDK